MKKQFLLLVLLSSMQAVAIAEWVKYGSNPIVTGAQPTSMPVVLEIGGSYRMWYISQPVFGRWDVCYATSTDALHWTPQGAVFSNGLQNHLGTVRYNSSSGTFQMWYSWGGVSGQIGYASSNDGISWQDHGLVLNHGSGGSYDAYVAQTPHVLYDQQEGLYKMWYTALQEIAFRSTIAYATSSDGINWTKHGVVFSPKDGSWYSGRVSAPYVDKTSDGYLMYFHGGSVSSGPWDIGHVKSTDGINWDDNSVEIDLTPGSPGSWDSITVSDPWVLTKSDGKHILYYAGSDTSPLSENPDGIGIALQTPIEALVDINPDSLNKNSKGEWVTVYITLPADYDVSKIDVSTIAITSLTGTSCQPDYHQAADLNFVPQIGDRDEDGIPDITVKFNRQELTTNLCLDDVAVTVEGKLCTGEYFKGTDHIRVIERGK